MLSKHGRTVALSLRALRTMLIVKSRVDVTDMSFRNSSASRISSQGLDNVL